MEIITVDMPERAELAGGDQLHAFLECGGFPVAEVDQVDHAVAGRLPGGSGDLPGFGERNGQRFFAEQMLAGLERGQTRLGVEPVRRDDVHGVNAIEQFAQAAGDVCDAVFRGELCGARRQHVVAGGEFDAGHFAELFGMVVGHAAGADDAEFNF